MDNHEDRPVDVDAGFFRAIVLGALLGVPALWIMMTAIFSAVTDASFISVAGFAALPAAFCGPFLGGLFTTAFAHTRGSRTDHTIDRAVRALEEDLHGAESRRAA
jgi:hypothetical protein